MNIRAVSSSMHLKECDQTSRRNSAPVADRNQACMMNIVSNCCWTDAVDGL